MKYLCLVYGEENALQRMDDAHCLAYDESIRKSGHCVASEALESVSTATTVRVRKGQVMRTDGPFAETKEVLCGYNIIEADSMEEAVRIASEFPWANTGCIEVRPIRDMDAVRARVGA